MWRRPSAQSWIKLQTNCCRGTRSRQTPCWRNSRLLSWTMWTREEAGKGTLSGEAAADTARAALSLLGNALAQISKERRRKGTTGLNKKVHLLADEEEIFADTAPLLLGKVLRMTMKTHLESLKCPAGTLNCLEKEGQNFWRSHSGYPPWGSGRNEEADRTTATDQTVSAVQQQKPTRKRNFRRKKNGLSVVPFHPSFCTMSHCRKYSD